MMMHRLTDVVATTKHTVLSLESLRKFDHRRMHGVHGIGLVRLLPY